MADSGFLGLGWNFPVGLDDSGQIAFVPAGEEGIRQSIWTILATSPGERVMRPDFGCGIYDLVFGVNNAATATAVTRAVREALATWEPRIDVARRLRRPGPFQPQCPPHRDQLPGPLHQQPLQPGLSVLPGVAMQAPLIDKRSYADLVAETSQLAGQFSGWQPRPDGQPDAGQALIGIFARFAELVIERLNRAPDKNYLAFLNLIGASPIPPQAARVPLTFHLATSSPVDGLVPAGTLAAAPPQDGEQEDVVFETERSLVVTRAQLQAAYVSDTETDTYSDRTAPATGTG